MSEINRLGGISPTEGFSGSGQVADKTHVSTLPEKISLSSSTASAPASPPGLPSGIAGLPEGQGFSIQTQALCLAALNKECKERLAGRE